MHVYYTKKSPQRTCPIQEGEFRFDALLKHLESYGASKFVAIGEDATLVISMVDYDIEAKKLVGLVLPSTKNGLPLPDALLVISFDSITSAFQDGEFAKYAFVYVAQTVTKDVHPFCLCCLGTNNKFTAEQVLQRWKYIYLSCKKLELQ